MAVLERSHWPGHPHLAMTFRNQAQLDEGVIRRAKLIDLGVQLGYESVALLLAITPIEPDPTAPAPEPQVEIWVQLHPVGGTHFLPPTLHLSLLSETGEVIQSAKSRHQDNYIQLKRFRGAPGECFDIRVAFGKTFTTEAFMI